MEEIEETLSNRPLKGFSKAPTHTLVKRVV